MLTFIYEQPVHMSVGVLYNITMHSNYITVVSVNHINYSTETGFYSHQYFLQMHNFIFLNKLFIELKTQNKQCFLFSYHAEKVVIFNSLMVTHSREQLVLKIYHLKRLYPRRKRCLFLFSSVQKARIIFHCYLPSARGCLEHSGNLT